MNTHEYPLAEIIWTASRDDEGTISATGANIVARAILNSSWLAARDARVWDEAREARPQYLGPRRGHYEDCMGWEDCECASYPNPYRTEAGS